MQRVLYFVSTTTPNLPTLRYVVCDTHTTGCVLLYNIHVSPRLLYAVKFIQTVPLLWILSVASCLRATGHHHRHRYNIPINNITLSLYNYVIKMRTATGTRCRSMSAGGIDTYVPVRWNAIVLCGLGCTQSCIRCCSFVTECKAHDAHDTNRTGSAMH